jgi:glycerol-3-phosphate dehydrogenase (NAD(P)+)
LWARRPELAAELNETRANGLYLSGCLLPPSLVVTSAIEEAVADAGLIVVATPSHGVKGVLSQVAQHAGQDAVIVSATKGFDPESLQRMSELAATALPGRSFVALSGPSFAAEVARGVPTAIVAASSDMAAAMAVQQALSDSSLRVYTNDDVIGVEVGGATKNVIAIATGVVSGLGLGHNAVAAIITRGLAEVSRLALAMGGHPETMAGLAGLGDLVLTCTGGLSRNRYVGQELGRGRSLDEIRASMREVAEGINTAFAARTLGQRVAVELPITEAVCDLLSGHSGARGLVDRLMGRPLRSE